ATCTRSGCPATSRKSWRWCRGSWTRCTSWCCARNFPRAARSRRCSSPVSTCATMPVAEPVREGVIDIARQAAAAILEVYAGAFEVVRKDDASPVTAADMAAHHVIVDGLRALTPDIPVLSEECADEVEAAERLRWPRLWLVDPLDGTREFVKRNGEFSVNIALIEDGVASFGVIQQPVTGTLWFGAPGRGAWMREGASERRLRAGRVEPGRPLRVAASRSHRDGRTQALME